MKAVTASSAGWEAYVQTRSPEIREQLLVQYLPLVRRVAGRMVGTMPRSVRLDDLVSAGVVGLLSSFDNFDPSLGIKFETFAMNRIRGAMVDSLRELDWVPRSVRQKVRQLERVVEALTQEFGRPPEDAEIAERLNVSLDEYLHMLDEVNVTTLLSLDDTFPSMLGDGTTLGDQATDLDALTSHDRLEEGELRDVLVHNLKRLPDQERLVVALYYYEELTFKEIGAILRLTESRVSQIHSKAILKLRAGVRQRMNR
ncbi:FliA/WhiG family RNA polymerase sigma factor [bacterium]|nr:FliA/WhiG family RNA polymerase sigma factor [bacterium]MBU1983831.1 FliA/WhiG family RNA polymerase sigma factor [bacterium]